VVANLISVNILFILKYVLMVLPRFMMFRGWAGSTNLGSLAM